MEENNFNSIDDNTTNSSKLSNILIGILLIVIAFLAFNFFKAEPTDNNVSSSITGEASRIEQGQEQDTTVDKTQDNESADKLTSSSRKVVVMKGDSLWKIAKREYDNGYLWTEIAKANGIDLNDADKIEEGMELNLPDVAGAVSEKENVEKSDKNVSVSNKIYVVKKGDTLWSIAKKYYNDGFKWNKIFELKENQIEMYTARDGHRYPLIEEGMVLVIPEVRQA